MNISNIFDKKSKLSTAQLDKWFFSLEQLIGSGLSILDSLDMLEESFPQKNIPRQMKQAIRQGDSLQTAMLKTEAFDGLSLSLVESGEQSGNLDRSFGKLHQFHGQKEAFRKEFLHAMYYPLMVLTAVLFLLGFIVVYFVPSLMNLYGGEIPQVGQTAEKIIRISLLLKAYFPQILYTFLLILLGLFLLGSLYADKRSGFPLSYHLPFLGQIFRKQKIHELVWSAGLMMESGIDILRVLTILEQSQNKRIFSQLLRAIHRKVAEGASLNESIQDVGVKERELLYFVGLGEETGDLSGKLNHLSNRYQLEIREQYKVFASLFQPLMVVCMVVLLGALMLGVVLPLLDTRLMIAMAS